MASLWALERADEVLNKWANTRDARMWLLIAEELDRAEHYGFRRGFETHKELGQNIRSE